MRRAQQQQPTLGASLERAASSTARLGLVDRRERLAWVSWARLEERARGTAGRLQATGVLPGERIGLIFPTGEEFVVALLGAILAGAVPVPLYPPVRLGRLDEYHRHTSSLLERVGGALLLVDRRSRRLLGPTVERARLARGCRTLAELPAGDFALATSGSAAPDELALVQFSSGTTVDPKPVALTHRQILAQVRALNSFWPPTDGSVPSGVSWLPLYHDMGLVGCLFAALDYPGDLTLIPPELFVARPALWLRTLSRTGAAISPAPNFAYGLCVEKIRDDELDGVDLSRWKVALCGAETAVPQVLRSFVKRFSRWGFSPEAISPVYGLSEAALAVTFSDLDREFVSRRFSRRELSEGGRAVETTAAQAEADGHEIASLGRPLPGFSIAIRGEGGEELACGEVGRVWVSGPSLMEGYLDRSGKVERPLAGGWLDTGDLGFLFEGELYLTGRAKDVIVLRGRNHSPEEVELALDRVAGVRTGCTAAVGNLEPGGASESLWVFVERARGAVDDGLETACCEAILARTGLDAARVILLEPGTLPRTSSGKIRRREALARYLAGELSAPDAVRPLGMLLRMASSRSALGRAERDRRGR